MSYAAITVTTDTRSEVLLVPVDELENPRELVTRCYALAPESRDSAPRLALTTQSVVRIPTRGAR